MFASKDIFLKSSGGYQISRSVRLRNSASAYLNRTPASASNRRTWTYSGWVKRGLLTTRMSLLGGYTGTTNGTLRTDIDFQDGAALYIGSDQMQTATDFNIVTTQIFRDPSAWYHIVVAFDTTQSTSTDRVKVYVNGVQVTAFSTASYPSLNYQGGINFNNNQYINRWFDSAGGSYYGDGYMTEINFIDGQALTPSSFGQINSQNGVWQPIRYAGTYGTNGFYLNFSDNSSNTATTIGKDYSGNGNNWTPNNISVTAGVTYDSMLDVPTNYADGGNGRGNYATLNPLDKTPASTTITASNGNLQVTSTNAGTVAECMAATIAIPANSGKWYWECQFTTENDAVGTPNTGIIDASLQITSDCYLGSASAPASIGFSCDGQVRTPTGNTSYTNPTSSQVVGFAYDSSNGKLWVAVAGTWQNSGDPAAGTGQVATASWYTNGAKVANSSNRSLVTVFNFGQRPFAYTPPTGFVALNTQNLPTPTISNGANYMAATIWTGDGTNPRTITNTVNGVSFKPDLVWTKARSNAYDNTLYDSVRGTTNYLISNSTAAEASAANTLQAFNSNGFQVGGNNFTNSGSVTYVGWQWQAGQGSTSSNTSGSITSTVSVNATAGFSIVTYTGNGTASTVGHGLGVSPAMVIAWARSTANGNAVWHKGLAGNGYYLQTSTTAAQANTPTNVWNSNINPTSTTFTVGSNQSTNTNGTTYVAYCFAAVAGYSAFGSYTGNGSTDGVFVYCGFRPRWVMIKSSSLGFAWIVYDTSRSTYNSTNLVLQPNVATAEVTAVDIDVLSNGFKFRTTDGAVNQSSGTYIYAAFAENPFKYSLAR